MSQFNFLSWHPAFTPARRQTAAAFIDRCTDDTRKRSPGTCTIGELQLLARVLPISEKELFAVVRAEATWAADDATSA